MALTKRVKHNQGLTTQHQTPYNCHLSRHAVILSSIAWRCLQGMRRTQALHYTHFKADESFDIKNVHFKSKSVTITKVEGFVWKRVFEDTYLFKRHECYFFPDICK